MSSKKKLALLIILIMLSPLIFLYFSILDPIALWIYAWFPGFFFVVFSKKSDLFMRGLLLIAWTVFLSAIGIEYLVKGSAENAMVVNSMITMLNMIAGGVGGNFIAHDLISMNQIPKVKKPPK